MYITHYRMLNRSEDQVLTLEKKVQDLQKQSTQ